MNRTNLDENNLPVMDNSSESGLEAIVKKKKKKDKKKKQISYKQELLRKTIHLLSLSIPIAYIFLSRETALMILVPMALIMVFTDILTKKVEYLNQIYQRFFGAMLRKHEKKKKKFLLNGASWVLISAVVTVFVFPKIIAITGFTILIVSDISAALIGRKFGKTPLFNKTWEGTSAFIVSAIIVVLVLGFVFDAPISYYIIGSLGAIVGGFAEASSKLLKMDDNFSIPISVGIVMWICGLIAQNFTVSFI